MGEREGHAGAGGGDEAGGRARAAVCRGVAGSVWAGHVSGPWDVSQTLCWGSSSSPMKMQAGPGTWVSIQLLGVVWPLWLRLRLLGAEA